MRWAIVKSSLSTIRATVDSCACAAMTASSSDASRTCVALAPKPKDLAPRRASSPLCPAREPRLDGSCSAHVLVSAKWRGQLLSKLWTRMAGGIRLTRRHRGPRPACPYAPRDAVRKRSPRAAPLSWASKCCCGRGPPCHPRNDKASVRLATFRCSGRGNCRPPRAAASTVSRPLHENPT
jgi:hypothetical protein